MDTKTKSFLLVTGIAGLSFALWYSVLTLVGLYTLQHPIPAGGFYVVLAPRLTFIVLTVIGLIQVLSAKQSQGLSSGLTKAANAAALSLVAIPFAVAIFSHLGSLGYTSALIASGLSLITTGIAWIVGKTLS